MNYKVQPWGHQLEALEKSTGLRAFALFFEMGLGKSSTVIHMLRERFNSEKRIMRTIIFCPPIVCKNWKDEWIKHSSIDPDKVLILSGTGRERLEAFNSMGPDPRIVVTNYESLLMTDLFKAMYDWQSECIVFDE